MTGSEKIRNKLVYLGIASEGEVNAARIEYSSEYSDSGWNRGWHLQWFYSSSSSFLGDNLSESLDLIEEWAFERDQVA